MAIFSLSLSKWVIQHGHSCNTAFFTARRSIWFRSKYKSAHFQQLKLSTTRLQCAAWRWHAVEKSEIDLTDSQTAAGPGVGAIEEESQDANGRSARQETNGDQRKPWRFATCRGHAHLHGTALSESGGLCQGSSLMLRAATQHLRSCEALTWQQHVGGACHHSQHQQVGATCHVLNVNCFGGTGSYRC